MKHKNELTKIFLEKNIRCIIFDVFDTFNTTFKLPESSIHSPRIIECNDFQHSSAPGGNSFDDNVIQSLKALFRFGFKVGLACNRVNKDALASLDLKDYVEAHFSSTKEGHLETLRNFCKRMESTDTDTITVVSENVERLQHWHHKNVYTISCSSLSSSSQQIGIDKHLKDISVFVQELIGFDEYLNPNYLRFGPFNIRSSEVFYQSRYSYGLVNLRPIVPGHVLVLPKRLVSRVANLHVEELNDMWISAQRIGKALEAKYKGTALTFAIQDGVAAGQTVPHVHIHILPRKENDFHNNDQIYHEIEKNDQRRVRSLDLDRNRGCRTLDEMAEEATELRSLF